VKSQGLGILSSEKCVTRIGDYMGVIGENLVRTMF
jgi:hypothetical protein